MKKKKWAKKMSIRLGQRRFADIKVFVTPSNQHIDRPTQKPDLSHFVQISFKILVIALTCFFLIRNTLREQ